MKFVRNWKISVPVAGAVLAGLAWLAFGLFGIHTAFVDDEVAEALPEFDVPAAALGASADVDTVPSSNAPVGEESVSDRPTSPPSEGLPHGAEVAARRTSFGSRGFRLPIVV